MGHLAGVSDPEQKRKIIGREFVEVFQAEAKETADARWLAKGRSIGRGRVRRHQDQEGDHHQESSQCRRLPETLGLKLLEPLRELFRTRFASWAWRLACHTTWSIAIRSPAPGSACGFSATSRKSMPTCCAARTNLHRRAADHARAAFGQDLVRAHEPGLCGLPACQERRRNGRRSHLKYVVALRAVETRDFMTAHWAELPHALLGKASNRIINEVRGINRVV